MSNEEPKVSKSRAKKVSIVASLDEKLAKSIAIVFTNYQGLTHKQLEGLKKAIKPMNAEFVVAKNSLILRALDARKLKLENEKDLDGQTGTLFIYEDLVSPLKELAKLIKELGIPSVKFGIMDGKNVTGEDVLKLSTLPSREVLLSQIAAGLKSPIYGLHRALSWNIQKFIMTLNAISQNKPVADVQTPAPTPEPVATEPVVSEPVVETEPATQTPTESAQAAEAEPETILEETAEEKKLEEPAQSNNDQTQEVKSEGGEN